MTTFAGHLLTGDHATRPAATAVPAGTLYSCDEHSLLYQSDGAAWSTWATLGGGGGGGSTELKYVEGTSQVTITSTSNPGDTVVSAGAHTFDGSTRVRLEWFFPHIIIPAVAGGGMRIHLVDGSTDLGWVAWFSVNDSAGGRFGCVTGARYFTPSAASHTYTIKAYVPAGDTGYVGGGTGGDNLVVPHYIRIATA